MTLFKEFTQIDGCGLTNLILEKLAMFSEEHLTIYDDFPKADEELVKRISDSDCALVSWRTKINVDILQASKSLKYIGVWRSLYDEKSTTVNSGRNQFYRYKFRPSLHQSQPTA